MQLVRADIILISLSCIWSAISQDCRSNPDETCASTGSSVLQKNSGSGIALEDGLQRNAFEASDESAPNVVDCGFESGLCGWTADARNVWRTASHTPSKGTGPQRGGHNSSLKFAFVEASDMNNPGEQFVLSGPSFGALPPAVTFEFWYHMYGANMGKIVLESYNGATWSNLWEMEGNKGDKWLQAIVSLPAGSIMLRFVATVGKSFASDFALDDLSISTTQPPTPTTQPPVTTTATTTVSDIIIPVEVNATETDRVDIKVSIVK